MTEQHDMNADQDKVVALPDLTELEREAAIWVARFDDGEMSEADIAEFNAWRSQSDQHKDAIERMSALWGGMAVLEELKDYAASEDVTPLMRMDAAERRSSVIRRVLTGAIAASLMVVVSVGIYQNAPWESRNFSGAYETAVGEQETVTLPDGSKVVLNTDSAAEIVFSKKARTVRLSKGEAFFDVTPDKDKPFSVETEEGVVTAVGTAFSVRVREGKIDVLVTEGRIALMARDTQQMNDEPDQTAPARVEVSAGQSALFSQKVEAIDVVEKAALDKKLDWQDGMLSFKGQALEDVIAELERYTNVAIDIDDPDLRRQKVVVYYRVGEIETMFEALQLMADIRVERVSESHVKLYRLN